MTRLLGLKDISGCDTFDGTDEAWDTWSCATTAVLGSLGWRTILDEARQADQPIKQAPLGTAAKEVSANLFLLLARKCHGKSLAIVKLIEDSCGLEGWRCLYKEYEPGGAEPHHAMLAAIVQPKWWASQGHRGRVFTDVLYDWENLTARYSSQSGEVISDSIKCATVLGYAPKEIEMHLRHGPADVRRSYALMRGSVREFILGGKASESYAPLAPTTSGLGAATDMDVGAVTQPPTCDLCKKVGHTAETCWFKAGSKGKGKGKGKGKKGGKGGKGPYSPGTFSGACN